MFYCLNKVFHPHKGNLLPYSNFEIEAVSCASAPSQMEVGALRLGP